MRNRRHFIVLAVLAIVAQWQSCGAYAVEAGGWRLEAVGEGTASTSPVAELEVVAEHKIVVLEAKVDVPKGHKAKYAWKVPAGFDLQNGDCRKAFAAGAKGTYDCFLIVSIYGDKPDLQVWPFTRVIGDAPPVVDPVEPTLAQLAGEQAGELAKAYSDLRTGVEQESFSSVAAFRAGEAAYLRLAKLEGNGASAAIDALITAAVDGADELDDAARAKLAECLAAIVKELGAPPPVTPPPVEPTPVEPLPPPNTTPVSFQGFYVLFVSESGEGPRWLYDLVATPAVLAYLNAHCEGGAAGWRKWDQHETGKNAAPHFRELAALPEPAVPCVAIANKGRAGVERLEADMTPEALVALLKKYGGP